MAGRLVRSGGRGKGRLRLSRKSTPDDKKSPPQVLTRGEMTSAGKYTILRKIADGGMAEIFLAQMGGAKGFQKLVVLKRIRADFYPDSNSRNLLVDEAHVAM